MKRFLIFVAAMLPLVSCGEKPAADLITDLSPDYSGTMIVTYEGNDFVQEEISVKAEINEECTELELLLEKVKFVPAMPISIDVTIKGIPVEKDSDGSLKFSADGIVPWAMGGPYETYRVDNLTGTIKDEGISFTMDFFNTTKNVAYPTSYTGDKR